jgi:hypothetical protein
MLKNLNIEVLTVVHWCETWSLILREEYRLSVSENYMLRKILGSKRKEVEERRKLHSEELNDQYCSPNVVQVIKSRRMRWMGPVAHMADSKGVYRV